MLVIYYFKTLFLLSAIILTIPSVYGQGALERAIPKKTILLKLDAQKRAYYIDTQGDKVIILDYKTRKNLQAVSSYSEDSSKNGRLTSKSFYKETPPDEMELENTPKFETYTSKEGDTWNSISQKLYNDVNFWVQLKLWNEDLLKYISIPKGSTIKYIENLKN